MRHTNIIKEVNVDSKKFKVAYNIFLYSTILLFCVPIFNELGGLSSIISIKNFVCIFFAIIIMDLSRKPHEHIHALAYKIFGIKSEVSTVRGNAFCRALDDVKGYQLLIESIFPIIILNSIVIGVCFVFSYFAIVYFNKMFRDMGRSLLILEKNLD